MGASIEIEGVRLWRGDEIESVHVVAAAVVDDRGRFVARHGDPARRAFLRSSAKPIQLLPLVEEGLVEAFGFTPAEVAVMTASHNAEPVHLEAVRSILAKAGLDESRLKCGPHEPMGRAAAEALRETGERPTAIHNNCSGKHAGMLAACRALGWPLETYREADHPLQRRIWQTLAELAGLEPGEIGRAVDGCGVPVFALPVTGMARAWAALAAGDARRGDDRERAIGLVFDAMATHPVLVAGEGRIDTDLLRAHGERLVVKTGAEGVFCAALRGRGGERPRGLALKVVDGASRAQDVALLALLETLGAVAPEADPALAAHARPEVRNRTGTVVGRIDARLPLEPVEPAAGAGGAPAGIGRAEAEAIVRLGAAAASGDGQRLASALDEAGAVDAGDIEELLLQTYLFAGFPRTINAFFTWQAWASRDGRGRGERRVESSDADALRRRGEALCRTVYGDHYEPLQIRLRRLHPEIAEWTLVEGYGKVLGRPGRPGAARRELGAVGALIALGAERQLASHLRGAVHVGVSLEVLAAAAGAVAAEWGASGTVESLLAALGAAEVG